MVSGVSSPDDLARRVDQDCGWDAVDAEFLGGWALETLVVAVSSPEVAHMRPAASPCVRIRDVLRVVYVDCEHFNAIATVALQIVTDWAVEKISR